MTPGSSLWACAKTRKHQKFGLPSNQLNLKRMPSVQKKNIHIHSTHIYIYIYICLCIYIYIYGAAWGGGRINTYIYICKSLGLIKPAHTIQKKVSQKDTHTHTFECRVKANITRWTLPTTRLICINKPAWARATLSAVQNGGYPIFQNP